MICLGDRKTTDDNRPGMTTCGLLRHITGTASSRHPSYKKWALITHTWTQCLKNKQSTDMRIPSTASRNLKHQLGEIIEGL